MKLINVLVQLFLLIGGAFLGDYLNMEKLHIGIFTSVILAEAVIMSLIIKSYEEIKKEAEQSKETISRELLSRKMNRENSADITVFPDNNGDFPSNSYTKINITINSPITIGNDFDLQLISDKEIRLKVSDTNTIETKYHSGRYLFLISGNFSIIRDGKYQRYDISIMPLLSGQRINLELTAQDQEVVGTKVFVINSI